jgi:hypothetical protein
MQYDKPKDFTNYAYIRLYTPPQETGPLGPIENKSSDYGFDGLITFSGGTAASGVRLSNITTINYMPYREIIPSVELQKMEVGKLMENSPEIRKR